MRSSGSTARVLAVIEALSAASDDGVAVQAVIERTGLAPSTVYRLLMELEEVGLLYRTADRRMHANFTFARRLSFETISPPRIAEACAALSGKLQAASEIIVLQGHNLIWHIVQEHPAQAIRLRAHTGYARETYELDSLSRLTLAHVPLETIERKWDRTAFFDVGVDHTRMSWDEAHARIEATDPDDMQYDILGNAKGIRRFCIAIRDGHRLGCLLTVAEAATPLRDTDQHVEMMRSMLFAQRAAIEKLEPAMPATENQVGIA